MVLTLSEPKWRLSTFWQDKLTHNRSVLSKCTAYPVGLFPLLLWCKAELWWLRAIYPTALHSLSGSVSKKRFKSVIIFMTDQGSVQGEKERDGCILSHLCMCVKRAIVIQRLSQHTDCADGSSKRWNTMFF